MTEQSHKSSYKEILKATSIFGGVQVITILITIVRSKIIAILLGPAGMGIVGLLTSTTALIASLTNFGLETSAVKSVAEAHAQENNQELSKTVSIFRKLVWGTGLLGALVTMLSAPYLSQLTFGDRSFTWSFVWLSLTLLLNQLTAAENVLLQGTRQLKFLASANILGSLSSLLITIPLYYFFGLDGVVPALIVIAFVSWLVASFFTRKIAIIPQQINWDALKLTGGAMLKLGFFLSLSGLLAALIAYILRIYISNTGGVDDVGFYTAGFQIIGTYVGLVFTAMGTDYFPRLAAVAHIDEQRNELVNQQAVIALIILLPIIIAFIFFAPWVVRLLYSSKFEPIQTMIIWAAYGMYFKAVSWAIAFQFLARADSKLFFLNELFVNMYMLLFNIIGYTYYGLDGLGMSYLITYALYLAQVYLVTRVKFSFQIQKQLIGMLLLVSSIGACALLLNHVDAGPWLPIGFTGIVGGFAIWKLNKLTGLLTQILSKFQQKNKN